MVELTSLSSRSGRAIATFFNRVHTVAQRGFKKAAKYYTLCCFLQQWRNFQSRL